MLLPDHISKPLIYSTQGNLSPKTSPQAQHLNIFPNKGVNIDKAWELFFAANWQKCWEFNEVLFISSLFTIQKPKEGDKEEESTTMAARVEAMFDQIENFKDILRSNIDR